VKPMEWWISDHRQFDVMVRNTLFAELKPMNHIASGSRPSSIGEAARSSAGASHQLLLSRTINSALRLAVLSHGFPRNFYWDNGEDYKKFRRDLEKLTLSDAASSILAGAACRSG